MKIEFSYHRVWPSDKIESQMAQKIPFHQSEAYFNLLLSLGQRPLLMTGTKEGRIMGLWLFCESPPNFHLGGRLTGPPFSWISRGITSYYGPLIEVTKAGEYIESMRELLKEVTRLIFSGRYYFNNMVAPVYDGNYVAEYVEKVIREEGFKPVETFTFMLNLDKSIDELKAALPRETRNKLNKAQRQEIEVFEGQGEEELLKYYGIRCENMKRNGVDLTPCDYYRTHWRSLHEAGVLRLFLSRKDEHILAGQLVFTYNEVMHLWGVAVSDYCISQKLAGNDALQWALIEWGHRNRYKVIDYAGAHPFTKDEKLKSIHAFKARWGGRLIKYHTFSLDTENWRKKLHRIYRTLRRRRPGP